MFQSFNSSIVSGLLVSLLGQLVLALYLLHLFMTKIKQMSHFDSIMILLKDMVSPVINVYPEYPEYQFVLKHWKTALGYCLIPNHEFLLCVAYIRFWT